MKRLIYMISIFNILLLCSCGMNLFDEETGTADSGDTSFSKINGILSNFSCLQFGDRLLYLTDEYNKFYILFEDGKGTNEIVPNDLDVLEITASNSYIYVYCEDMNTNFENGILLVYDENIELIKSLKLPFDRVCANNDTIYGYHGGYARSFFSHASNNANPYIECNYYIKESDFLNGDCSELQDWKKIDADDKTEIDGLTLYRHNADYYHEEAFYSSVIEMPLFEYKNYILYCDGRLASDERAYYAQGVVDELYELMKQKESNFEVQSFEHGDTLYGVCNVYTKHSHMQEFYTRDIDYSFVFSYDNQNFKKLLEVEDMELVYSDGTHLLTHQADGIYLSDMNLENQEKVFDWDEGIYVTVLNGVVKVVYDNGVYEQSKIDIKKLW